MIDESILSLVNKIKNQKITSKEVVEAFFNRIEKYDDKINAFITTDKKTALKNAEKIDKKIKDGEKVGNLAGIPFALKDNMMVKDVKTTCASKMLENFISPYNSTIYNKLAQEDAILVGKTNMDEFAMGSSNETSYFGNVLNPWDTTRVPGGSSGGSAASVAAGFVPFSLGSDTGGSIRQPASFCGIVGIKPTYGLVSRYGLVAFASSLDQIGPFTKNVKDAALILNIIAGADKKDSTAAPVKIPNYLEDIENDIEGKKIAVPKEFLGEGITKEVKNKINDIIKRYEKLGVTVDKIDMPMSKYSLSVYYILASAEASSNLARFDGIRYGHRAEDYNNLEELYKKTRTEGFGDEVKRRIMLGTYTLSSGYYDAFYKKAQKVRTLIKEEFEKVFEEYDAILTPTGPSTAFKFGEKSEDPLEMYLSDICTVPVNIAGVPAISINAGFDSNNMPIGMQLIGKFFDEKNLFNIAYNIEKELDLKKMPEVIE